MVILFADIYVSCVSSTHCVANKGFYLALVATTVETANPEAELLPGLKLLEPIKEKYVNTWLYLLTLIDLVYAKILQ
jgi:Rab GDP dissociation inhibitor